jgi:hypothetical protein
MQNYLTDKNMDTAGIIIEHNAKGVPTLVHIDLKKYGDELKDFFTANGISVESSKYDPDFVAKIKSQENLPGVKIKASQIWE